MLRGRHRRRTPPCCSRSEVYLMRPIGLPSRSITSSHASTHCATPMHSGCRPRRMSVPGRARVHARAARDAVAGEHALAAVLQPDLRVAAPLVVGHQHRVLVGQHVLQAAVRARDRAHLVAEPARSRTRWPPSMRHDREERALPRDRRRSRGRAAGPPSPRSTQRRWRTSASASDGPRRPLRGLDGELAAGPRRGVELPLVGRPALEEGLDRAEEELEVDRLRARVAAPHAAERRARRRTR